MRPHQGFTPGRARRGLAAALLLLTCAARPARAAELRVLAAGATESTLRQVLPAFEAQARLEVALSCGAVGRLRDRLLAGEAADLVIATPVVLEALEAKGLLQVGSWTELGRVGGGVAVRAGAARPEVSTPEELRQALLDADAIFYADPVTATAGALFLALADRLGVGEEVRGKGHTAPGGQEAMRLMAGATGAALGVTQVSEILAVPEVVLVGPYPPPLQTTTRYVGAVLAGAARPEAALALLRHLTGPEVQARLREAGFEPPRP